MVPKQEPPYEGIAKLLQHFKWTWIGLLAPEYEQGDRFISTFTEEVAKRDICVAYTGRVPPTQVYDYLFPDDPVLLPENITVFVYPTDALTYEYVAYQSVNWHRKNNPRIRNVWIEVFLQDQSLRLPESDVSRFLHGSLSFTIRDSKPTEYDPDLKIVDALRNFGEKAFKNISAEPMFSVKPWDRCTETGNGAILAQDVKEKVLAQDSYSAYSSIQAVARALHAALTSRPRNQRGTAGAGRLEGEIAQPWQVLLFPLRHTH